MPPDQPPLPTPINLPSHPSAGIHTSILISESEVGRIVAATRQKAGSFANGGGWPELELGGVNAPAPTASALVMVVSGTARVERLSQSEPKAAGRATRSARIKVVDTGPPLDSVLRGTPSGQLPLAPAGTSIDYGNEFLK